MKQVKRASTVTVRSLLSGGQRFAAPPLSRGYAWGAPELAHLLLDLEELARQGPAKGRDSGRLYLGSVMLGRSHDGARPVIDGQQRLAALVLILATIRDRLPGGGERRKIQNLLVRKRWGGGGSMRLRLRGGDNEWFGRHVVFPGATLRLPDEAPEGGPERLLASARFLGRSFSGKPVAELRTLASALLDATAVVLVQAIDERDEHRLNDVRKSRAFAAPVHAE
ncbi:MAG: DUF262 domain-containing protein [Alphaproteobacteria bacterium]|nr:DUF262 domain-containing protein [Alphaproteobacteria bacterium]